MITIQIKKSTAVILSLCLALVSWVTFPRLVHGQAGNNGNPAYLTGLDACAASNTQPLNVAVNISGGSAATTQVIALSAGKQIFLCEWTLTIGSTATTATTLLFEYGTGTNCATSPTALTGAMGSLTATAGPAIMLINGPYSGSTFVTPAGKELCLVTTGPAAGINIQGQITYKQL
jgi:hypothetical protein